MQFKGESASKRNASSLLLFFGRKKYKNDPIQCSVVDRCCSFGLERK